MKLSKEEKIKFWVSTLGKVVLILFVLLKTYDFLTKKKPPVSANEINLGKSADSVKEKETESTIQIKENIIVKDSNTDKSLNEMIELSQIIKFKGKPLQNAYFKIEGCKSCISTQTNETGFANIKIPKSLYEDGLTHRFYVYQSDSLIYQKSMRFVNFQLDEY